jgi:hypothetical protein
MNSEFNEPVHFYGGEQQYARQYALESRQLFDDKTEFKRSYKHVLDELVKQDVFLGTTYAIGATLMKQTDIIGRIIVMVDLFKHLEKNKTTWNNGSNRFKKIRQTVLKKIIEFRESGEHLNPTVRILLKNMEGKLGFWCTAQTLKSGQCTKPIKENRLCCIHLKSYRRCNASTKKGTQCTRKWVSVTSKLCEQHLI